jgi:DNA uptake protein ComE-like DNA-binding protein
MKPCPPIHRRRLRVALGVLLAAAMLSAAHTPELEKPAARPVAHTATRLVDINRATMEELETLPGIAEAFAAKIIKNRPYANKTQLAGKGILSASAYAKIKSLIIAKQ